MMEVEMEDHLGYEKSERSDNDDYRNGYKSKTVKSSIGEVELEVPQDRKSTFEPQVVKKGQKDISDIDHKIISPHFRLQCFCNSHCHIFHYNNRRHNLMKNFLW